MKEPAVLQEAAEHAAHADALAQAGDARTQRAHPADEEVDPRARLGGGIELVDDLGMREPVDLDADARLLTCTRSVGDVTNLLDQPLPQREGRHEQLAETRGPAEPGEVVEEIGDIGGNVLVCGEIAEVFVRFRGDVVVVAGTQMHIATEPAALSANDKRCFCVDLQVRNAVDDVHARLLECA